MKTIAILGANGFVGKNAKQILKEFFNVLSFDRKGDEATFFDFEDPSSWTSVPVEKCDVILNLAAYGVVKNQQQLETMYNVNYFSVMEFYKYVREINNNLFWIQVGTAFEYNLSLGAITEESVTQPFTHYGISKLMFSTYLQNAQDNDNYIIFRPFGMFGKYEDNSKIFPYIISAQKNKQAISLSDGMQKRDYIYVNDFIFFIKNIVLKHNVDILPKVINIGAGKVRNLKEMAFDIAKNITDFDNSLWQWGLLSQRQGESSSFYNASKLAVDLGLEITEHEQAFKEIINYY